MARIPFGSLPDDSRLWVFGTERALTQDEERQVLGSVDAFLGQWKAHGEELTCARDWRYGRFLLVGVDERSVPPSGCSIDAMVSVLKELEAKLHVSLVDGSTVFYRDEAAERIARGADSAPAAGVRRADRAAFRQLAAAGAVGPETVVFDQTVTRVGQLRAGKWERPAREAWHGRAFFQEK